MSEDQRARILDLIPVKKYKVEGSILGLEDHSTKADFIELYAPKSEIVEVILASDLELFLQKLIQPKNLNKLMMSLATGKKPDLEEFLK